MSGWEGDFESILQIGVGKLSILPHVRAFKLQIRVPYTFFFVTLSLLSFSLGCEMFFGSN